MGSISLREFIRWLPDEASEPTSTLVLTSPQQRFVDLRILQGPTSHNEGIGGKAEEEAGVLLPLDRLDWGIAGTTHSSTSEDASGNKVRHSKFQHWVSSRTTDPENEVDEGDMYTRPDGKTLEKGSMVNPATGQNTPYEELWIDIDPAATSSSQGVKCFVLQWEDGKGGRGRVVRLGQYCQGFLRAGDQTVAERWEWNQGLGWRQTVKIGDVGLPCSKTVQEDAKFTEGDTLELSGRTWKVVEAV